MQSTWNTYAFLSPRCVAVFASDLHCAAATHNCGTCNPPTIHIQSTFNLFTRSLQTILSQSTFYLYTIHAHSTHNPCTIHMRNTHYNRKNPLTSTLNPNAVDTKFINMHYEYYNIYPRSALYIHTFQKLSTQYPHAFHTQFI